MTIAVFTRSTPDTAAKVEATADGGVSWGDAALVVNPWDEYALEEGIVQAKNGGGKAVVIALGGELHNDALKHSLAMGLDEAIRVEDAALDPIDPIAYGTVAAAAVNKVGGVDLVLFGKESVDVGSDAHIVATARKLGWTMLSYVSKITAIDYAAKTITVERVLEEGRQTITSALPVVISVLKDINEPRYPSFIGIRKASKAVIPVWSLADLGTAAVPVRAASSGYMNLPARDTRFELISGTPEEQAKTLVDRLIEEKVL